MESATARLALTPGDPAGIGPDLAVRFAQNGYPARVFAIADPDMLRDRASMLNLPLELRIIRDCTELCVHRAGSLQVWPEKTGTSVVPGKLDTGNAQYVLNTLNCAIDLCLGGACDALVTGPVNKAVINDAGIAFDGHTGYLAARCESREPVMMLATEGLRVALATVHIPLCEVPAALTRRRLRHCLQVLHHELTHRFAISAPRILVAGLNPHAGEDGYLGREEIEIMQPVLQALREQGMRLSGPLPADTLFTPDKLAHCDAVLAMYHDQGLPVIKHLGFGRTVNITLGLPIVRTSVDHGTALDLAGSDKVECGSLYTALDTAKHLAGKNVNARARART